MDYFVKDNIYVPVRRGVSGLPDYARVNGQNISDANMAKMGYERRSFDQSFKDSLVARDDGTFSYSPPQSAWQTPAVFLGKETTSVVSQWLEKNNMKIVGSVDSSNPDLVDECIRLCKRYDTIDVVATNLETFGRSYPEMNRVMGCMIQEGFNVHLTDHDESLFLPNGEAGSAILIEMGIARKKDEEKKRIKREKRLLDKNKAAVRYIRLGLTVKEVVMICGLSESQVRKIKRIVSKENTGTN